MSASSHPHGLRPVLTKFAQGGGTGLLAFAGADTMTANAAARNAGEPPLVDLSSLDGIMGSVFNGGLTAPLQFAMAIMLFLLAGKCIARFAGLFIVAGLFFAHMQGVTLNEAAGFAMNFGERVAAGVSAFQNAQT
jgi:hypothetical protein